MISSPDLAVGDWKSPKMGVLPGALTMAAFIFFLFL
jgi:hypothetical protein